MRLFSIGVNRFASKSKKYFAIPDSNFIFVTVKVRQEDYTIGYYHINSNAMLKNKLQMYVSMQLALKIIEIIWAPNHAISSNAEVVDRTHQESLVTQILSRRLTVFCRAVYLRLFWWLATRLKSQPLYDLDSTRDSDIMTRDSTRVSTPVWLGLDSGLGRYDSDSTRDSDIMTRDSTQDSMRMTRRVCIILKFIVVLRSAADHRHVEIWK